MGGFLQFANYAETAGISVIFGIGTIFASSLADWFKFLNGRNLTYAEMAWNYRSGLTGVWLR